ncbi:PVC-type heme-binding CxxCH protein [Planctomicrobium sp. SH661]|uniref:PVC-type heme-binding CxxCH protein n=1 Tax=Planctomicrobium sp. SH661 TaxID=3448124 RepID=UPI003F5CAC36
MKRTRSAPYQVMRIAIITLLLSGLVPEARDNGCLADEPRMFPTSEEFYLEAVRDSSGREWQPLFNGQNLEGWKVVLQYEVPEQCFQVVDGNIHVYRDAPAEKEMPFGVLISDGSYSHFRFRFEYRWGEKKFAPRTEVVRDAGFLFHVNGEEKIWPMSVECQVQEGDTGDNFLVSTSGDAFTQGGQFLEAANGGELRSHYSPDGVTRVVKSRTLEKEGWNVVEVVVRGDAAVYLVNGEINNYVVNLKAPIGPDQELVPLESGRLALQCEGAELFYRKLEILPLTPKSAAFVPADESIAPEPALSPQESLAAWKVREGFRVELAAAEPLTMDPVAIDWGMDGKMWVAEMADYPVGMDGNGAPGGRIRFLEDTDADGQYDRSTLFLEKVSFPTGVAAWKQGVIVTAAPEIFYAEDSNGDGICDVRKVLFSGFQEGNQQLRVNGLRWGFDGWLYCASGSPSSSYGNDVKIRSHLTGEEILLGCRDFRFDPATGRMEPLSGPSQFGRNRDQWDNWFGVQNSYPLWHYLFDEKYLSRNPNWVAPDPKQLLTEGNPPVFPAADVKPQLNPNTRVGRFTSACSGMIYLDSLLNLGEDAAHALTCEPVHNLVQHNLLRRSGASFTLECDANDERHDFLASTDSWSRPVMIRTGPDGALWVVDMYRYIIEHPQFVPLAAQKEIAPLLRLGDGRGRIYRVVPSHGRARAIPDLLHAEPVELVKFLEHPNGWVRENAQRRLTEIKVAATLLPLRDLVKNSENRVGRLHAINTLKNLNDANVPNAWDDLLIGFLDDESPEMRRHGVRLAEEVPQLNEELRTAVCKLAEDSSELVRLQVALTLGEWDHPTAVQAFARMWVSPLLTEHVQAALFSSLNQGNIAAAVDTVSNQEISNEAGRTKYDLLVQQSVLFGHLAPVEFALQQRQTDLDRALMGMHAVYRHPHQTEVLASLKEEDIADTHRKARHLLSDDYAETSERLLAARLLFHRPEDHNDDRCVVQSLLSPTTLSELQSAVIDQIGGQRDVEAAKLLLDAWSGFLPSTRSTVLEVLAGHPEWYPLLTTALDEGVIHSYEIPLALQDRLINDGRTPAALELKQRFQPRSRTDGGPQLQMDAVRNLTGEAGRGRQVFQKHCSDCHQFRGEGFSVGPNLASVTGRNFENLFESIIDPNRAVEPRYSNYMIESVDGRIFSGLIENATDRSLILLKAKEERSSLLRSEIESLNATGRSLMPEGFDRIIPQQDLADLISYLQQPGDR